MDKITYEICKPKNGWVEVKDITSEMVATLRPIAETLAMLDGNAFFGCFHPDKDGVERDFWEQYLPEAKEVFDSNGGITGWAGEASFVKLLYVHERKDDE